MLGSNSDTFYTDKKAIVSKSEIQLIGLDISDTTLEKNNEIFPRLKIYKVLIHLGDHFLLDSRKPPVAEPKKKVNKNKNLNA